MDKLTELRILSEPIIEWIKANSKEFDRVEISSQKAVAVRAFCKVPIAK